jgi:hypothetical protein
VNTSVGIFGDSRTLQYIGESQWVEIDGFSSVKSAEMASWVFPMGGGVKGGTKLMSWLARFHSGKAVISVMKAKVSAIDILKTSYKALPPNITYPFRGAYPAWKTVQNRYWRLMNGGVTPSGTALVRNRATGLIENKVVFKELHHVNGRGGVDPHRFDNLEEVWPWEHEIIDASRHTGYDFIKWLSQ